MKRFITLVGFLLIYLFQISQADWTNVPVYINGLIRNITVNNNDIYVATSKGVYHFHNYNNAWNSLNHGLDSNYFYTVLIDSNNTFAGCVGHGIYRSDDGGFNWINKNEGLINQRVYSLVKMDTFIIAGVHNGVYISSDHGENWIPKTLNIDTLSVFALGVFENKIIAGTNEGGIFISSDYGNYWDSKSIGLTNKTIWELTISGKNIYVATNLGVFLSTDFGNVWIYKNNGITDRELTTITSIEKNIFVGTLDGGIYLSTDCGDSWNAINQNLSKKLVTCIKIIKDYVYVATIQGFFRSKLSDFGINAVPSDTPVETTRLKVIYLNNDFVRFEFEAGSENRDFVIYDILGNINYLQKVNPDMSMVDIDKNNFNQGVYFCILKSGNHTETRKFVVVG